MLFPFMASLAPSQGEHMKCLTQSGNCSGPLLIASLGDQCVTGTPVGNISVVIKCCKITSCKMSLTLNWPAATQRIPHTALQEL